MKEYKWVIINCSFLLLFYILRCLIINVILFVPLPLVLLFEGCVILGLLISLSFKEYRTRKNVKKSIVHITAIVAVFLFLGHLSSIVTLYLWHYKTIEIFRKYQNVVPTADRVNGEWILEEKDFLISDEERTILTENYSKPSPCFFQGGYCYFELGGFLKNSAGYSLKLKDDKNLLGGSLGFHRIKKTIRLTGNWMYYE